MLAQNAANPRLSMFLRNRSGAYKLLILYWVFYEVAAHVAALFEPIGSKSFDGKLRSPRYRQRSGLPSADGAPAVLGKPEGFGETGGR